MLAVFLLSCNGQKQEDAQQDEETSEHAFTLSQNSYQLLQSKCLICHTDKNLPHDELIAPPMAAVKRRYTDITENKQAFIEKLVDFTLTPSVEEAVMYGAVRRFNLMPPVVVPEDTLRKIAAFLYETDIQAPDWFAQHYREMHPSGQRPTELALEEKISAINQELQPVLRSTSSIPIDPAIHDKLLKIRQIVDQTSEEASLMAYHKKAAEMRRVYENQPQNDQSSAVMTYQEALIKKIGLLESAENRVEAEFILLHIRRQLQMLDQHFVVD